MSSHTNLRTAAAGTASLAGPAPRYPIDGMTYHAAGEARRQIEAGNWIDCSIGESLRRASRLHPSKVAIVDRGISITFADLDLASESISASLLELGLRPGDRALFQLGTSASFFKAFFGCLKAGVIPVCTLPQYREAEMRHFAAVTEARAIFVQADVNLRFDQVAFALELAESTNSIEHIIVVRGTREKTISLEAMEASFDAQRARRMTSTVEPSPLDVAVFQLSGGSTNLPKIIPRMHGEYLGATLQLSQRYDLTGDDVTLWSLPLIHNAGTLFAVLPVALQGRTLVLQPQVDVVEMLHLVELHQVTFTGSIGPIAAKLLEIPNIDKAGIKSLRQFFSLTRAEAVEEHVGLPVGQMFGMTEGMVFAAPPTASARIRHDTVGYPVSAGDDVRLLVPGADTDVPFGEIGELCFRGPSTLTCYFKDPETTKTSFSKDGYLRSGDLMRAHLIDGHVCYSFEGRIKDNINRGGEKIGAEEIEGLVGRHPDVADVRVVAMPDPVYGEKACAFIIPHADSKPISVESLGAFLLSLGIAKYKLPERVEVIDMFPLTKVGKADKAALRSIIATKLKEAAE